MKTLRITALLVVALVGASALGSITAGAQTNSQTRGQRLTEAYSRQLENARPYPLGQMNDSAERANLTERLLRMNNPNKIGYVTLMTQMGQVVTTFVIKGKVSSTASQLTNTQNVYQNYGQAVVVDSMGDDGSYGPEEGGKDAIFFFTSNGVLIEWNGWWQYTDAPVLTTTAPVVTMDVNAKPTTNEGHLLGDGQK